MSLGNLGLPGLLTGLLALAGLLFILQRLRVRYREHTVLTTIFWKEALEEARARVFMRRFRHLLAYLFVLLIASLLWIGYADPRGEGDEAREQVVLLDASAGMFAVDAEGRTRFDRTKEALLDWMAEHTSRRRRVFLCGSSLRTVLLPEESPVLLEARLDGVRPELCPAEPQRWIELVLAGATENGAALDLVLAGSSLPTKRFSESLPKAVALHRLAVPVTSSEAGNRAVSVLGLSEARSGLYERVDLRIVFRGSEEIPEHKITIDGKAYEGKLVPLSKSDGPGWYCPDVPASGGLLEVELIAKDSVAVDNVVRLRLPRRDRLRVQLDPSLKPLLGPVLALDPIVELVNNQPDLRVTAKSEADTAGAGPELAFVPRKAQKESFLIQHEAGRTSEEVLAESVATLGLEEVDAMDLAEAAQEAITLGAAPGKERSISVWSELLGDRYNFTRMRSFPLFLARAVRWLGRVKEPSRVVAAGRVLLPSPGALTGPSGKRLDSAGAPFVIPEVGSYRSASGDVTSASLLYLAQDFGVASRAALSDAAAMGGGGAGHSLSWWLALLLLPLLLYEWFLVRSGRMP